MDNRTPALVALYTVAALGVALLWFGAYGPIWRASWSAQPADWLGFAGNLLAGLMTLSAAGVAYLAVRMQVRSDQEIASRGHHQAMRAIKNLLRPLFECLDVLRTVFDETLAFVGTDEEQLTRTTWLRGYHYTLPPETIIAQLRAMTGEIDTDKAAFFEDVLFRLGNFYRLTIKYSEQTDRTDELKWRLHDIRMMRLHIELLKEAVKKFEPAWVKYFGNHVDIGLDNSSYADVLRSMHDLWKEEEAHRRAAGGH